MQNNVNGLLPTPLLSLAPSGKPQKLCGVVLGHSDHAIRGWHAGYNQMHRLHVMETDVTEVAAKRPP